MSRVTSRLLRRKYADTYVDSIILDKGYLMDLYGEKWRDEFKKSQDMIMEYGIIIDPSHVLAIRIHDDDVKKIASKVLYTANYSDNIGNAFSMGEVKAKIKLNGEILQSLLDLMLDLTDENKVTIEIREKNDVKLIVVSNGKMDFVIAGLWGEDNEHS